MKKIFYSNVLKIIAVLLFILSIVSGVICSSLGIIEYESQEKEVYGFERSYSEISEFYYLLTVPENEIYEAYYVLKKTISGNDFDVLSDIEERFENLCFNSQIDYHIKLNDKVYTNCGAQNENELVKKEIYRFVSLNKDKNFTLKTSQGHTRDSLFFHEIENYKEITELTICVSIKDDVVREYKKLWETQRENIYKTGIICICFLVISLISVIYLVCVCGVDSEGKNKNMWLDRMWVELRFLLLTAFVLIIAFGYIILIEGYCDGYLPLEIVMSLEGILSFVGSGGFLAVFLSIIRSIKQEAFLKTSVLWFLLRLFFKVTKYLLNVVFKGVRHVVWSLNKKIKNGKSLLSKMFYNKTGMILLFLLFIYTVLIAFCGIILAKEEMKEGIILIFGIVVFGMACFFVSYRTLDIEKIKKGVREIKNGNLSYEIAETQIKSSDMKVFAEDINSIAKGLDHSVNAKLKAERMKTELITNVSHDLKTPLTSIINYTQLLMNIKGLTEEAQDYVKVIENKSNKLKQLTQDLFDVSRVQSGNENVNWEMIDISLLINQSLGELDNEIKESSLLFCVNIEKELYIRADGRKMSRVINNLLNNILKYTMKNTRVFVSSAKKEDRIVLEFKNIANYPMNFNGEDIVERFVRGDESRTKDGNGLGLAIAKSYTQLCGGTFDVIVDGDMFKTVMSFESK